ncbi:MAG: aminodeoxychorismate synthase component I [Thiobacillaceae bacterium]
MAALHLLELPGQLDLAAIQAAHPERYPGLFRTTGTDDGWDILFGFPQHFDCFYSGCALADLQRHPALALPAGKANVGFVASPNPEEISFPFSGGWLVFLAYELGGLMEPRVGQDTSDTGFPIAWMARIPAAILQQPGSGRCVLLAEPAFSELIGEMLRDAHEAPAACTTLPTMHALLEESPERFLSGVSAIADYIRAGDVFQVNLSRSWVARFSQSVSPSALFATLMENNPAPFSALVQFDGRALASSSPERLVSVERGGKISTRPIAGTHPRGQTVEEDDRLRARLADNPKERAEHVMLVDLERNDLGRVCVPGSVQVEALMDLTRYQYVHHIESTISGILNSSVRVFDILRAVFPGGTITGCPKIRTMQIIRELEVAPREAYTGSVGYINHDGSLDFNILIRSFQLRDDQVTFRAGAGIVADSEAGRELAETRTKARGLLNTLGVQ